MYIYITQAHGPGPGPGPGPGIRNTVGFGVTLIDILFGNLQYASLFTDPVLLILESYATELVYINF